MFFILFYFFKQISQNIDDFRQNNSQRLSEFIEILYTNPLREIVIFTICQNYVTWF